MPNNINYNLNYFIMRKSGTKPMKNTMRKSPINQTTKAVAKSGKTETGMKTVAPKSNPAGKPASKMETSAKAPTMQMKKSGMGKKC